MFKEYMNKGHSAAWDLDWQKAASFYRLALEEQPADTKAMSHLAAALFELQEYEEAMRYYHKVAEADPDDPLPLEKIAQILEHQGKLSAGAVFALRAAELHLKSRDVNKAIENWTRCITLNPDNLQARTKLAVTYERLGRKPQAVAQYLAVASLMQRSGDKQRAIELVQHALKLMPNSNEAKQALGLLRANQLLPRPAHKPTRLGGALISRKSLDETPQLEASRDDTENGSDPIADAEKRALTDLAELMFTQSDDENITRTDAGRLSAIAMGTGPLSRARVEHHEITLRLSQAVDLQARGKFQQAADELERAIKAGLDHAAAYFDLGVLRARGGKLDSAVRNLQSSVGHPDYALASRLLLGQTFRKLGRSHEAAIQYLEALRLADSMMMSRKEAAALRQVYESIIEVHTLETSEAVHKNICDSVENLLIRPDWREQIEQARQQLPPPAPGMPPAPVAELLTQAESSQVVEILTHIHQLARNGYHRVAMEEAFRAVQYAPTYLPLHTFMGEILLQQDHVPEAIAKFNVVARAYSVRGDTARAIGLLTKITRLAPLDLSARRRLIEQLTASGQVEATIHEYLDLGDVYYRLAELDKARDVYMKALNVAQQSGLKERTAEILHHLADIDLQRLDWRRALRLFNQIHNMNPDDRKAALNIVDLNFRMGKETEALAALGNFVDYLNRQGKEQEAIEMLEELLQDNPDRVAIRRTLAEQYQRVGRVEDAIAQWDQVGDRLLDAGDQDGAAQAIRAIIQLNPPNAADYQKLLEELDAGRTQ